MKKILGQQPSKKKSDKESIEFELDNKQTDALYEAEGVDKETRRAVKKAARKISFAAIDATCEEMLKTKKKVTLHVGSGDGSMIATAKPTSIGRNPQTGEQQTNYCPVSLRIKSKVPGGKDFTEMLDKHKQAAKKQFGK